MELPDCPPGTEGYEDSVIEIPKKLDTDETCTKAEQEFQDHLVSLKINLEDGEVRPMVQRYGRDNSRKWIYRCLPCAAVCSGETILQTHLSGRKHKTKLSQRSVWPKSIFAEQPVAGQNKTEESENVSEERDLPNKKPSTLEERLSKYRNVTCHIQEAIDNLKTSLVGVEYLIEHPPERATYEPTYFCTLCNKQGHPRTIINHMTCFWHNLNYIKRHFPKAEALLVPYRNQSKYREGTLIVINRLKQRIEDTYGRMRPLHIDKDEYEKYKEQITQWIFQSKHFSEKDGNTFEEVIDVNLIDSLHSSGTTPEGKIDSPSVDKRDPSPPVVAAPTKPLFNNYTQSANRQERRTMSIDSLSDISDITEEHKKEPSPCRTKYESNYNSRYAPYPEKKNISSYRSRYSSKNDSDLDKKHTRNEYKYELAEEKRKTLVESMKKTLAYHEKYPEKHPLYPEEWKKFWNKRYKEIQAEGKDPSKHDFKPEWILFWTQRMQELHDDELRIRVNEMYRKLCISPSEIARKSLERRRLLEVKRRSPEFKRRSPEFKRRSPEVKRRSPEIKRQAEPKRWSPVHKRRSPVWERSSTDRRRSPDPPRRDCRRVVRSPDTRRSPGLHRSPHRQSHIRSRSPPEWRRSSSASVRSGTQAERTGSPLSRRDEALLLRNRSPEIAPSLQTVLVSDDDLEPDTGSPDSMTDIRSRAGSEMSRGSRSRRDTVEPRNERNARHGSPERGPDPQDMGPVENIVATLRLLVALEDYLGSLGPKIVDLLAEALKMEKEKANSSETLLERESALVLIETAKEKLKGAMQAGLVSGGAAVAAARAAVVRTAATLHAADSRIKRSVASPSQDPSTSSKAAVPVAGIGVVDRAQIAQQMAEALIAQGKTDVTSEELAQLVEAVVGMAEAKKMENQKNNNMTSRSYADQTRPPSEMSGTASALQLLQSAYDENEKKMEKAETLDAMDGLSDSDLETLLKNFNELSAEEQHSLIAYLKKLEAREPQRVERLRQYVSAAAPNAAPVLQELPPKDDITTIQSDDDDYTVEEIFQSATQKVKEDQIRQEMEIVKKSLEEFKSSETTEPRENISVIDITRNISSASDLLALMQASIQSTARPPFPVVPSADVVTTNIQPRSFGDSYEPLASPLKPIKPLMQTPIQLNLITPAPQDVLNNQTPISEVEPLMPQLQNRVNHSSNRNIPNPNFNQEVWNQQSADVRTTPIRPSSNFDNYNQPPQYNNQVPQVNFVNGRQDNFDTRQSEVNQQYGGYQKQQNNFRGRGFSRSNYGGPKRGRGRGGYYQ